MINFSVTRNRCKLIYQTNSLYDEALKPSSRSSIQYNFGKNTIELNGKGYTKDAPQSYINDKQKHY
jgi:hypothetical protein